MGKFVILSFIFFISFAGSDKMAYRIFDKNGKQSNYEKLIREASKADIILFGEMHNNPISHWMELEVTKDISSSKKEGLLLGAEMFEADNQAVLNDYLSGKINEEELKKQGRMWPNFHTDYQPLLDFAKDGKIPFIATNVPRKYANMVYKSGLNALDTIPSLAKSWMVPLPMKYDSTLKCYKDIFAAAGGHGGQNLPKSQALKDATMAHFILQNLKPGQKFIHYNGAYHSNNFQGIMWYIKQARPDLKVFTISCVEQKNIEKLEKDNLDLADFIFCIPEDMTKTY